VTALRALGRSSAMATVWIERIYNFRDETFVVKQNDGTWHPYIYQAGEPSGGKRYLEDEPIQVPPGAALECSYFFIPWSDWGRVRIEGPAGSLEVVVGPANLQNLDYLRGFDEQRNEVLTVQMGPRGGWWSSSLALHLVFDQTGVRWVIWSATNVMEHILQPAAEILESAAPILLAVLGLEVPRARRRGLYGPRVGLLEAEVDREKVAGEREEVGMEAGVGRMGNGMAGRVARRDLSPRRAPAHREHS
jgi:hypothetical protein